MCWGGLGQAVETAVGSSSSLAIRCIFLCLALVRPLVSLCLAAMHRMWSSKVKVAERRGKGDPRAPQLGLWTVTWRHLESSLSPLTSRSCRNPENLATPQPSL